MILSLEVPNELASRLTQAMPEKDMSAFTLFALEKAIELKEQETEERAAAELLALIDPRAEPEREAAECQAAVEAEYANLRDLSDTYTLEELKRELEAAKAAQRKRVA